MLELLHTPTEMHPPSAQEFALQVRQLENGQAPASNLRMKNLFDLIIHLFGGPTLF